VPNLTAVAPDRFDPLTVTTVPPAVGPALGATDDTPGTAVAAAEGADITLSAAGTTRAATTAATSPARVRADEALERMRPVMAHYRSLLFGLRLCS
jgi:hypothetical protein